MACSGPAFAAFWEMSRSQFLSPTPAQGRSSYMGGEAGHQGPFGGGSSMYARNTTTPQPPQEHSGGQVRITVNYRIYLLCISFSMHSLHEYLLYSRLAPHAHFFPVQYAATPPASHEFPCHLDRFMQFWFVYHNLPVRTSDDMVRELQKLLYWNTWQTVDMVPLSAAVTPVFHRRAMCTVGRSRRDKCMAKEH